MKVLSINCKNKRAKDSSKIIIIVAKGEVVKYVLKELL